MMTRMRARISVTHIAVKYIIPYTHRLEKDSCLPTEVEPRSLTEWQARRNMQKGDNWFSDLLTDSPFQNP
jgi:predicted metal-dependent hydrolase